MAAKFYLHKVDGVSAIEAILRSVVRKKYEAVKVKRGVEAVVSTDFVAGRVEGRRGRWLPARGFVETTVDGYGHSEARLYCEGTNRLARIARRMGWRNLRLDWIVPMNVTLFDVRVELVRRRVEELEMAEQCGIHDKGDWKNAHRAAIRAGDWIAARRIGSILDGIYGFGDGEYGLSSDCGLKDFERWGRFGKETFSGEYVDPDRALTARELERARRSGHETTEFAASVNVWCDDPFGF